jgi:hypothetical protein
VVESNSEQGDGTRAGLVNVIIHLTIVVLALFARPLHDVMIYPLTDVVFAITLVSVR